LSARVAGLKAKYQKYSDFIPSHAADFVDADTGKYWWQCNNSLNNIINALIWFNSSNYEVKRNLREDGNNLRSNISNLKDF